jgi:hypothetical protein
MKTIDTIVSIVEIKKRKMKERDFVNTESIFLGMNDFTNCIIFDLKKSQLNLIAAMSVRRFL